LTRFDLSSATDIELESRSVKKRGPNVAFAMVEAPHPRFSKRSTLPYLDSTVLQRLKPRPCKWNGCDAMLASEWHLEKHLQLREHAREGLLDDVSVSGTGQLGAKHSLINDTLRTAQLPTCLEMFVGVVHRTVFRERTRVEEPYLRVSRRQ
jgi:hypothetical protein